MNRPMHFERAYTVNTVSSVRRFLRAVLWLACLLSSCQSSSYMKNSASPSTTLPQSVSPSSGNVLSMATPCNFVAHRLPTTDLVFDASAWSRYFGDVGEAPALPGSIEQILDSRCPFWGDQGKQVRETHLLTLIPSTVNGRRLALNLLGDLIQSPKNDGHATNYVYYSADVSRDLGDVSPGGAYWALLTRDVLPGSCSKDYALQKALVAKYPGYALPSTLEVVTSILCHHVRSKEHLLSDAPLTYTRCKDVIASGGIDYPVVVGGFSLAGLYIHDDLYNYNFNYYGVVGFRKF